MEIVLILIEVVFCARLGDADEVVRYAFVVEGVVVEVFAGTDVHAAVNLTRVGTDNLTVNFCGEMCGYRCFTARCGAEDCNHCLLHKKGFCVANLHKNFETQIVLIKKQQLFLIQRCQQSSKYP